MLVCRGTSNDLDRAEKIIRKVLSLQVTDPEHKYHGIWPWLMEEPVDQMAPPDRNWADFLGAQLALLLKQYTDRLPDPKSVNHRGECCVTAKFLSLTNPVCRSHE
jgi:hypothetical protein